MIGWKANAKSCRRNGSSETVEQSIERYFCHMANDYILARENSFSVSVMREYKLKWLKCLSEAEKLKYQSINTP